MDISLGWVKTSKPTTGADHLGTQAPCTQIYTQLLPGITNVTDRARCYSLYPWVIWSLDRRGLARDKDELLQNFRRSECLLTLIAERHARKTGEDSRHNGAGMAGRDALLPALSALEEGRPLRLSTHATREDVSERYFKNSWGGMGQYYLGSLQDLRLLDGSSKKGWILCSQERAEPLAKAVDARVNGDLFFRTITDDEVTLQRLDGLSALCPCKLREASRERELMIDLMLDRRGTDASTGPARKASLLLMMHWAQSNGDLAQDLAAVDAYQSSIYALDERAQSSRWAVPPNLVATAKAWRTYERNDLMSVAVQAVFYTALCRYSMHATPCANSAQFADWWSHDEAVRLACRRLKSRSWGDLRDRVLSKAPSREDWAHDGHEYALRSSIVQRYGHAAVGDAEAAAEVIASAIRLVLLVAHREGSASADGDPYADCPLPPNYDADYPITLRTLQHSSTRVWPSMGTEQVLTWLATEWGLKTHLMVALRKLRQNPKPTFKILPTEEGLKVQALNVAPSTTMPRLFQSMEILEELALIRSGDDGVKPSADGARVLAHELAH